MSALTSLLLMCIVADVTSGHDDFYVVDLTHEQGPETIYWPGDPGYNFTTLSREKTAGGYWYESNYFGTAEHAGTHVDAPAHFYKGGWRAQQIPMGNLMGPGVVINVKANAAANPDYEVTVEDLRAWENKHNSVIPKGAVVLMNSGWSAKYPTKKLVFGTDNTTDPSTFHFPAFHIAAIDWLIANRNVHVVGVDTPSTDYGQSTTFPVHVALGQANIVAVENVAYLDNIPENGTMVYVALIKLFDGSGGPARVFSTYSKSTGDTSTAQSPFLIGRLGLCYLCSVLLYLVL